MYNLILNYNATIIERINCKKTQTIKQTTTAINICL